MSSPTTGQAATDSRFHLAEGPQWDATRGIVRWVDINSGQLIEGTLDAESAITETRRTPVASTLGAIAAAESGAVLAAAHQELVAIDTDGRHLRGPRVIAEGETRRLNDGKPDPRGRFVVGTLSLSGASEHEQLLRLEHDGSITVLDSDLTLSNGLAWSPDGRIMYSIDTLRGVVYRRAYDAASGAVGERFVHITITDGYPDGCAMDADGYIWIAIWGAGCVRRFAPDGAQVDEIRVPAPHTSCPAFAGEDLRTLVITTATQDLTEEQLAQYPDSGRLFTARVDTPGQPVPYWNPAPVNHWR